MMGLASIKAASSHSLLSGGVRVSLRNFQSLVGICGRVIGPHCGWFGAECQCGRPLGSALQGAHGAGTRGS